MSGCPCRDCNVGYGTILFLDGSMGRYPIHVYPGACLTGQSTAYVIRNGGMTWVKPGESVGWVESDS